MPGLRTAKGTWFNPTIDRIHNWTESLNAKERLEAIESLKADGFMYFGSRLELDFYRYALDFVPKENIILHEPICLIPAQPEYRIKSITWAIDFKFENNVFNGNLMLPFWVETKGFEERDFKVKYALFHYQKRGKLLLIKESKEFNLIQQFIQR